MDKNYRALFFETFKEKFIKDLQHLDQEIMYKILWSFAKSDLIKFKEEFGTEWSFIKKAIIKKAKDMDPKILTNILVLATVTKSTVT